MSDSYQTFSHCSSSILLCILGLDIVCSTEKSLRGVFSKWLYIANYTIIDVTQDDEQQISRFYIYLCNTQAFWIYYFQFTPDTHYIIIYYDNKSCL